MIMRRNLPQIPQNLKCDEICNLPKFLYLQGFHWVSQILTKSAPKSRNLTQAFVLQRFQLRPRFEIDPPHYMWVKPRTVHPHVDGVSRALIFFQPRTGEPA